jgi:penicillin amidase
MRLIKFAVSFAITLALVYFLDNRWVIGKAPLPPLGKLLDPFHGFWQNIEPRGAKPPTELHIPGLQDKVTLVFDSLAIPHIFASNEADLYLAQGYVTAMHRLWQMEIQTHAAAGRVSEIAGPVALENDRYMRRLGMTFGAQHAFETMMKNDTTRRMIEKYAEGVNAYIQSLHYSDLAFEYKLLDYRPEPWTPLKSALLLKNMAYSLCMRDKDIEMTNALQLFGPEVVDLLYPDQEGVGEPIVDQPGSWKFASVLSDSVPSAALPKELIQVKKKPGADPTTGSNNWAVHGSKTATGSPMLCNDPHLNLSLPSLWYVVQLHGPGTNCMGASLPGTPGIIIGFTDSVAWGVTNAQRDLIDWFRITYKDSSRQKYRLDERWADTRAVVETIHVRGEDPVSDTVYYTHWGPITYDNTFKANNDHADYAFRWIAHDPSLELLTFYKLNRARSFDDYKKALDTYQAPAQNFVFASVQGDVAMRVQGKFPARRKNEGRFVLDGSLRTNGWQAFIPVEQNIAYRNPPRGFVSSANQYPVDNTYPYYITATSFEAYRNRRINSVLSQDTSITVADMMALQTDNYNLKAAESLPAWLKQLDSTRFSPAEMTAFDILKAWNYTNTADAEGAAYYEAWWDSLYPNLIWDELSKGDTLLDYPTTYTTLKLMREKPDLAFFDIQKTPQKETVTDIVRLAFTKSVQSVEQWKKEHAGSTKVPWGAYKDSRINHLLRLEPLSVAVNAGGNHDIVNAFSKTHGPSWRMIVSLEKTGVKAWGVYPGGQSGNPGSPHYADMIDTWTNGKYPALHFLQNAGQSADKFSSIVLTPSER